MPIYFAPTTCSVFGRFRRRSINEIRFDKLWKKDRVNRTPSDGQGLISGPTPCPRFGHPGTSSGQGPHHEIRPCPLKRAGKVVGVPCPHLGVPCPHLGVPGSPLMCPCPHVCVPGLQVFVRPGTILAVFVPGLQFFGRPGTPRGSGLGLSWSGG